jgi:hypothetical protein
LLYRGESKFQGYGGPQPSFDGKYIAGLVGTGYGDACVVDSQLLFFKLAGDYKSAEAIQQEKFTGLPVATEGMVYPAQEGAWQNNGQYAVTLNGTCDVNQSLLGVYSFDLLSLKADRGSVTSAPLIVGDLGWGTIHGKVLDVATGEPVIGATVTCQHSSYTSPTPCSGTVITNAQGMYTFMNVFFHDTDTVKLTVQASGYQTQEITQTAFTVADMEKDVSLSKAQ